MLNENADFQLNEILELDTLSSLLDHFCQSVGISAAIIDLQGNVLIASNWQKICTDFHRINESSCARCIESDTDLAIRMQNKEPFAVYQCKNGMTDAASPIVIEGNHIANVFIGQFLTGDSDKTNFTLQAHQLGFDKDAYLNALKQVPIVSEDKLPTLLGFLAEFANLVASTGLQRLRAERANIALSKHQHELETLVKIRTSELALQNHILEQIGSHQALAKILEDLIIQVESLHPEMLCAISLVDKERNTLINVAAPQLANSFLKTLEARQQTDATYLEALFNGERDIRQDLQQDPHWQADIKLLREVNIHAYWAQPFKDQSNAVIGVLTIYHQQSKSPSVTEIALIESYANLARLIVERKAASDEIKNLAFYDALTGLPNRRLLIDRLKHVIISRGRGDKQAALLFIDLDKFKKLNDTLGHDMGDSLLTQVAQRLRQCVRSGDTVSRLGGDEFVLILKDLSKEAFLAARQTELIAHKIIQSLGKPYQLGSHEYQITPSIGLTMITDANSEVEDILKQGDLAMYQAKKAGRNTLRFFNPQMQESIDARVFLERALSNAVKNNEFQLHYQLQVNHDGKAIGAEALIRWQHPAQGLVPPSHFLPLAEESGLIIPIGDWVLETACAQLKEWQQHAFTQGIVLSVNISGKQFRHPNFVTQVLNTIEKHKIYRNTLQLELTEILLLDDIDSATHIMNTLNAAGVMFSLDDFGTGYSSLQYLKKLPLDQLKIDQSFIRDITTNTNNKALVQTIIAIAKGLNLSVIAEGVETQAQKDLLFKSGNQDYQGYFFSKPLPIEEFEGMLRIH
jgi:diguanylate cyclase (GGDEF)-like protein